MPTPQSNELIRTGLVYSGLILAAVAIPLVLHPDRLSENPIDWIIGALAAFGTGFALSTIIWFVDRYLPQLTGGSALKKQIATLVAWLAIAAALLLTFTLMSNR